MKSWYPVDSLEPLTAPPSDSPALDRLATDPALTAFLDGLRRLEGVPLSYLICDPAALPPESIRLFYVDPNWIACLLQGALDLGDRSRSDCRRAMARRVLSAVGPDPARPVSGFLLRSQLLSGWPGLTVSCFETGRPLPVLRLERLNDTLLLCLVEGRLDQVTFTEPQEGLSLGFTEQAAGALVLELVSLDEGSVGLPLPQPAEVAAAFRTDGAPGVLDLRQMALQIQDALDLPPDRRDRFSALDLTVELLKHRCQYTITFQQEADHGQ